MRCPGGANRQGGAGESIWEVSARCGAQQRPDSLQSESNHALCGRSAACAAVKGMRGRQLIPPDVPGRLSRMGMSQRTLQFVDRVYFRTRKPQWQYTLRCEGSCPSPILECTLHPEHICAMRLLCAHKRCRLNKAKLGGKALELFRRGTTFEGEGRSKERKAEFLDHGCVV